MDDQVPKARVTRAAVHKACRPRAARACDACRTKKNKCDELYPCTYCKSWSPFVSSPAISLLTRKADMARSQARVYLQRPGCCQQALCTRVSRPSSRGTASNFELQLTHRPHLQLRTTARGSCEELVQSPRVSLSGVSEKARARPPGRCCRGHKPQRFDLAAGR